MASLPVYNLSGKEVGKYEIDPASIAEKINKQLLHDVVVMYQANARQGSFKTKTRAEVAGSTKKMYRQKGTGNARAGSRRSNIRRGGGHAMAKRPRDFSYRLPRKAIRLATRMAIRWKDSIGASGRDRRTQDLKSLRLSRWLDLMKAIGLEGKSDFDRDRQSITRRSTNRARNIERVEVLRTLAT